MTTRLQKAARRAIDIYPGANIAGRAFDNAMIELAEAAAPEDDVIVEGAEPAWHEGGGAHWLVDEEGKVIAKATPYKHADGTEIHVVIDLKDNEQIGLYWGIEVAKEAAEGMLL